MYTVKQARLLSGLTQHDMAKLMKLNIDTYRRIEKHPQESTMLRAYQISAITGISIDDIIFIDESTLSRVNRCNYSA